MFLKINNYYFVWMSGKCFQYVWTIRCLTRKYLFGGVINVLIDVVPFRKRKFKIMNNFKHNLNFQCWKNVPGPMWMVVNFAYSKILMWFKINWWRRRWKDIWNVENTFCNYVMYEMIVIIGMKYIIMNQLCLVLVGDPNESAVISQIWNFSWNTNPTFTNAFHESNIQNRDGTTTITNFNTTWRQLQLSFFRAKNDAIRI